MSLQNRRIPVQILYLMLAGIGLTALVALFTSWNL
jgi:uncharacterized membrane protein